MRGNSFGRLLVLSSFGESHGPAIGAVIDGMPAGVPLDERHIAAALARRRPGQSSITSARNESDVPELLSGVFHGQTLGTPIAVIVRNTDARSADYDEQLERIGHADAVWMEKYGVRDYRGGGRSSGRETIARVIGGAIAERLLPSSASITACTLRIGDIEARLPQRLDRDTVDSFVTRCPDPDADARIVALLEHLRNAGNSAGGVVELRIDGMPAGLGEPVFHKLKATLTAAIMSIGAVSGVMLGDAFAEATLPGSRFHSAIPDAPLAAALRSHGIQGGLSNGQRMLLRVAIKPTSSIGETARQGRHDPCIVPRVIPVIEAMAALVLADALLAQRLDRND